MNKIIRYESGIGEGMLQDDVDSWLEEFAEGVNVQLPRTDTCLSLTGFLSLAAL